MAKMEHRAVGVIGGADGPTNVYLKKHLLSH